jgi:hypothetical protein
MLHEFLQYLEASLKVEKTLSITLSFSGCVPFGEHFNLGAEKIFMEQSQVSKGHE